MNDYILMKIFKFSKKKDIEIMHKSIKDMNTTKNYDGMFRTMLTIKNKEKKKELKEQEEKKF